MASKSDIEAGRSFVRLFLKDDLSKALAKALNAAGKSVQTVGRAVATVGAPLVAAGGAITGAMGAAVATFTTTGDALAKMRDRTGVSVEALSELGYAAGQSGASLESLDKGFKGQARSILSLEQGAAEAVESFEALGLSIADLQGLAPDAQFKLIADRLSKIDDPSRRAALAMRVFGKSGAELLPLMLDGAKGIEALQAQARSLGLTVTNEDANAAVELGDRIDDLKAMAKAATLTIGAALAPALITAAKTVIPVTKAVLDWVKENRQLVVTIAAVGAGVLAAGTALVGLGGTITLIGMALSGLASAVGVVGAVIGAITSPIGLVVAALAGGAYAWTQFTESGRGAMQTLASGSAALLGTVRQSLGGIFNAIATGDLALAGKIAMTSLRVAFHQGLRVLRSLVGDTMANVAGQLLSGDVSGAWDTIVGGMSLIWTSFVRGLVDSGTAAAKAIVDAWTAATTSISNSLIDAAAQDGLTGSIARMVLGVDMRDEQAQAVAKAQATREVDKRIFRSEITRTETDLESAKASGDTRSVERLTASLARMREDLAKLESLRITEDLPNVIDEAKQAATEILQSQAGAAKTALDEARRDAVAAENAAAEALVDRNARVKEALSEGESEFESELADLLAQAAEQRAEQLAQMARDSQPDAPEKGGGVRKADRGASEYDLGPTFNAAAAVAAGFVGQRPEKPFEREQQAIGGALMDVATAMVGAAERIARASGGIPVVTKSAERDDIANKTSVADLEDLFATPAPEKVAPVGAAEQMSGVPVVKRSAEKSNIANKTDVAGIEDLFAAPTTTTGLRPAPTSLAQPSIAFARQPSSIGEPAAARATQPTAAAPMSAVTATTSGRNNESSTSDEAVKYLAQIQQTMDKVVVGLTRR